MLLEPNSLIVSFSLSTHMDFLQPLLLLISMILINQLAIGILSKATVKRDANKRVYLAKRALL